MIDPKDLQAGVVIAHSATRNEYTVAAVDLAAGTIELRSSTGHIYLWERLDAVRQFYELVTAAPAAVAAAAVCPVCLQPGTNHDHAITAGRVVVGATFVFLFSSGERGVYQLTRVGPPGTVDGIYVGGNVKRRRLGEATPSLSLNVDPAHCGSSWRWLSGPAGAPQQPADPAAKPAKLPPAKGGICVDCGNFNPYQDGPFTCWSCSSA